MRHDIDCIVVGGGLVGSACAYGLLRRKLKVARLDEGDVAFRASRGNFGLIWVQGKGNGLPPYAGWTLRSSQLWPSLSANLLNDTGIDVQLSQPGGFHYCLTAEDFQRREDILRGLREQIGPEYQYEMLLAPRLKELLPGIGPGVYGASYTPMDGHANPLKLLQALHGACRARGSLYHTGQSVNQIQYVDSKFVIQSDGNEWRAPRLVLAAGLGNKLLAPQVGLRAPVRPVRGQILISERIQPFLKHPTIYVRQTDEGTIQIGDSHEEVGYDDTTRTEVLGFIARRALVYFPAFASLNLVRAWAALRVMSPDGFPIYQASSTHPGAFVVSCHSGVTLAAIHAEKVAGWIAGDPQPSAVRHFSSDRFSGQVDDE